MSFCYKYNQRKKINKIDKLTVSVSQTCVWKKERERKKPNLKSKKICLHWFQFMLLNKIIKYARRFFFFFFQCLSCKIVTWRLDWLVMANDRDGHTTHNHTDEFIHLLPIYLPRYYKLVSKRNKTWPFSTVYLCYLFVFFLIQFYFQIITFVMRYIHYHIIDSVNNTAPWRARKSENPKT